MNQRAGAVHRVWSIGRQVQDRGLELARINSAGPEIIVEAHVDLHPFTNRLLTQEGDIAQQTVDRHNLRTDFLMAREGEQLLGQTGASPSRTQRCLNAAPA